MSLTLYIQLSYTMSFPKLEKQLDDWFFGLRTLNDLFKETYGEAIQALIYGANITDPFFKVVKKDVPKSE